MTRSSTRSVAPPVLYALLIWLSFSLYGVAAESSNLTLAGSTYFGVLARNFYSGFVTFAIIFIISGIFRCSGCTLSADTQFSAYLQGCQREPHPQYDHDCRMGLFGRSRQLDWRCCVR